MTRKQRDNGRDETGVDREGDAAVAPSRTERKRESKELTKLGEALVELPAERWTALELPERLIDALVEAQRLTSFGARRRQAQFIGKLVRKLDDEALKRVRAAVRSK